jgi:GntR family transcriptional regulator
MGEPLYRRIAGDLRHQITSGGLRPGSQLPPEGELTQQFGASRNTVRDAVKLLITLGLVETRPGQGTFVVDRPDPLITTLTADPGTGLGGGEGAAYLLEAEERLPRSSTPSVELRTATGEIAARLGVEEGTPLVSRHQRRFIGSRQARQKTAAPEDEMTPWSMQTSFYPRGFVLRGAERLLDNQDIPEGAVRYLEEALGTKQIGYRDWITVRAPDDAEVAFFGLPPDGRIPVLEVFRTAFDQRGTPMRVTVTVFPADRNQFIVNVGDVPAPDYEPGP